MWFDSTKRINLKLHQFVIHTNNGLNLQNISEFLHSTAKPDRLLGHYEPHAASECCY